MKRVHLISALTLLFIVVLQAQDKKEMDKKAIKDMCGCFEVTFNFAETFNYSQDSLYKPSETKVDKGLEWAQLVADTDDKIAIQHILQVGDPSKPYIVKHWRQDWLYENTDLYLYNGDNNWTFEKKEANEVSGQWTQKVFQVDDSPRYEGSATWVHVDGKSYWENTTPAPLPRREYTKRADYNITMRGNRHEITSEGWVHDQDNAKVMRKGGEDDFVLAKEKGYNTYVKVPDERCQAAADWWVEHYDKWAMVRSKWDEVYARNTDLTLKEKVDNKVLYKHLFDEKMVKKEDIANVIESFVSKEAIGDASKSK
ncbi:hypothetical protein L0P88_16750 [Muricauda sp. SCSIO 64092]|uniref:DUF6607 family protein n=1 Tax=Allomuricauda sp. SCSIO 64092 TaxID=2908842 RepID=UPI001FF3CB5F|nr:DUF6607 family protein [Muricauda sp. SCSIO 64092]UOY05590.1 hypothetical protein L0P88_16750 [Muricauda sp. SCSIO 64092]